MKNIFITAGLVLMLSLVFAVSSGQYADVDVVQNGEVSVDYVDEDGERVQVQSGANGQLMVKAGDQEVLVGQNGEQVMVKAGDQEVLVGQNGEQVMIKAGDQEVLVGQNGEQVMIKAGTNNQVRLEVGGKAAQSLVNIQQESVDGKTKLSVQLSNGKNSEIKIMPDSASETALVRLKLKTCSEENGCSIELKEVGEGEKAELAYEIKTERQSKFLGLFGAKMQVQAQVNAETGELIDVDKPWWAVLASEPEEE